MKNRNKLALAVLAVAVLAGAAVWSGNRGKTVAVVPVTRGDIVQTVVATGRVNAPARLDIGAEVTGTIASVAVREGDTVKAGQLLVQLRDDEARAAVQQAQANLAETRSRLTQLAVVSQPVSAAAMQQAQAAFKSAQSDFDRVRPLVEQGFYPPQKMDDAQRALDTARSGLESARIQAVANQPGGMESQLAAQRLSQSVAALDAARARLDKLRLTSPVDAKVLTRVAEPGGLAQPGRVLVTLAAAGGVRIDANVDEKHLSRLQPGLKARALADAYPTEAFDAELFYIAPAVDPQRGTVEVRLRVPAPPAFVRPDMTVSVEMGTGARKAVLVLSADAVREADTATPWALIAQDGQARRVPLKLGLRGVGSVEVTDGLAEGDQVILPTSPAAAGDRVRAVAPKAAAKGLDIPSGMSR